MTHILGLQFEEQVIICSDSAVSNPIQKSALNTTSFGEACLLEKSSSNLWVSESALKIFVIGETALAFAGMRMVIAAFVRIYSEFLKGGDSVPDALNSTLVAIGDNRKLISVFAGFTKDKSPELYSFNGMHNAMEFHRSRSTFPTGVKRKDVPPRAYWGMGQYGSAPSKQQFLATHLSYSMLQLPPPARLPFLLAGIQNTSILENLIKSGVGGAYTGVSISSAGISFQPDMNYVIWDGEGTEMEIIATHMEENVLYVGSTITGGSIVLTNKRISSDNQASKVKQLRENFGICDHIALLHPTRASTTVLAMEGKSSSSWGSIVNENDSSFVLQIDGTLLELHKRRVPAPTPLGEMVVITVGHPDGRISRSEFNLAEAPPVELVGAS